VAIACLTVHFIGCTMWAAIDEPPWRVVGPGGADPVRVTRADSSQVVLANPAIQADSLVGVAQPARDTVSLPLTDVSQLEVRVPNRPVNGLIGAGLALVAILIGEAIKGDS
jgi:hypothetical protein